MSVPKITFPMEQAEIEPTCDMLHMHLNEANEEVRVLKLLIAAVQEFCKHPVIENSRCSICGWTTPYSD